MKAYVILVEHIPTGSKHISQESYTSLEKAQNFCENRSTTMEKINALDFESLNSSIKSLNDVISPLAKMFSPAKSTTKKK